MATIKIGSSSNRKGITVNPSIVKFNGNNVEEIIYNEQTIWGKLVPLVPTMTSATTPSGEVVASPQHSGLYGYYAFDGKVESTFYLPANSTTCENYTLGYKFPSAKKITNVKINCNPSHTYTIHVYGHSGNTKTELGSLEVQSKGDIFTEYDIPITNTNSYTYYSIGLSGQTYAFNSSGGYWFYVTTLQFYGREQ